MNAAYLYGQLENAQLIFDSRMNAWNMYAECLKDLADAGYIELPTIPKECEHNAHMFYIKCKDLAERTKLIDFLKEKGVNSVFHYIPLHSSPAGMKYGRFHGEDNYTTQESERLLRLPMYYNIQRNDINYVGSCVKQFYCK